jgi:Protein of unknown function (DUF4235)
MSVAAPKQDRLARVMDRAAISLMYTPIRIAASVGGGMLATAIFTRIWRSLTGRKTLPGATDKTTSWADVLPAAILHGMIFAGVKALVDRASAEGFEQLTGRWPGENPEAQPTVDR